MIAPIPVRCACGKLSGTLGHLPDRRINRVVCYCDDCQAFARWLGDDAGMLDEHGGSEILQTSSANLAIESGVDRLACVRLTPRGLMRWYTCCCRTAVGNTLAMSGVPFVGVLHTCLALPGREPDRTRVAGPLSDRLHGRYALGDCDGLDVHPHMPIGYAARLARLIAVARLRGDHRRSPFFDAVTGAPRVGAHVLAPARLKALKRVADR